MAMQLSGRWDNNEGQSNFITSKGNSFTIKPGKSTSWKYAMAAWSGDYSGSITFTMNNGTSETVTFNIAADGKTFICSNGQTYTNLY